MLEKRRVAFYSSDVSKLCSVEVNSTLRTSSSLLLTFQNFLEAFCLLIFHLPSPHHVPLTSFLWERSEHAVSLRLLVGIKFLFFSCSNKKGVRLKSIQIL